MRLAVSLIVGAAAFFAMALALIVLQEMIKQPLILVAAGMIGIATAIFAYILDMLTTTSE